MSFTRRTFGRVGQDRGTAMMGAKRCYVTPDLQLLDTKPPGASDFFQSRREAKRWIALKQEERFGGSIRNLRRQVRYPLHATRADGLKVKIGAYVADFVYERRRAAGSMAASIKGDAEWFEVVEDAKGHRTDTYKWKKHHFEVEYWPAVILEV